MRKFNRIQNIFTLLIFVIVLNACQYVSYFDSVSYKNLTDLKGEMKVAFTNFSSTGAKGESDLNTIKRFEIEISKGYEYEVGKQLNDNTVAQWKIINDFINETIKRFEENDGLSAGYCKGKWMILNKAFDIAISTENEKLKK